jgi:hypothetical protein
VGAVTDVRYFLRYFTSKRITIVSTHIKIIMYSIWDKISGKKDLKEKVTDMEEEIESLEDKIREKEETNNNLQEKIKRLEDKKSTEIKKKQEAFQKRNRLQDKVEQLEDRISKENKEEDKEIDNYESYEIPKSETREFLKAVSGIEFDNKRILSAYVEDDMSLDELNKFSDRVKRLVRSNCPCIAYIDKFGATNLIIEPSIKPKTFVSWDKSPKIESWWFHNPSTYTICVVRSDTFALGNFSNGEIKEFTGFKSRVKNNHSKGGFSQSRFERIRDKQIDEHIEKCRETIKSKSNGKTIILGSDDITSSFEDISDIHGKTDAKGKSKSTVIKADREFWKTTVLSF